MNVSILPDIELIVPMFELNVAMFPVGLSNATTLPCSEKKSVIVPFSYVNSFPLSVVIVPLDAVDVVPAIVVILPLVDKNDVWPQLYAAPMKILKIGKEKGGRRPRRETPPFRSGPDMS